MQIKRIRYLQIFLLSVFAIHVILNVTTRYEFESRGLSHLGEYASDDIREGDTSFSLADRVTSISKLLGFDKDDDDVSLLCAKIDATPDSSFQRMWEMKKEAIMKVSLISSNWTKDIRSNKTFIDWVDESMSYFTYSRLQHTMMSRPIDQSRSIGRIHAILENKIANPRTAPPLRIVVFGGSLTTGHYCLHNIFNYPVRNDGRGNDRKDSTDDQDKICSWSGRLQDMMNEVFGNGIVEVVNMAIGGAQTEMSTAVMEFGLIPGSTPDIIIWDHGMNDALTKVDPNAPFSKTATLGSEQIFRRLQKFYQATLALPTSCDRPDPPLVILLDSLLGEQSKLPRVAESLKVSTAISKMHAWYPDIWGVSYANTVRPNVLSKLNNQHEMLRLLGSDGLVTHPGMMYHISIAWTLMFNILYTVHDNCITRDIDQTRQFPSEYLAQSNDYFKLSSLPELHDELLTLDVPELWRDRLPKSLSHDECLQEYATKIEASKKFTNHSSLNCYYAWMVNRVLRVESAEDILNVLQPYIVMNEGWSSFGKNRKERLYGWLPVEGKGSYFELQFDDVPLTVNSLTIIYMQSYSEKWFNSTLQIDCTFNNKYDDTNNENSISNIRIMKTNETAGANADQTTKMTGSSTIRHYLSGYHEEQTSILMPIKLSLPNRELDGKSKLKLHFELLDGETFKIAGIALC